MLQEILDKAKYEIERNIKLARSSQIMFKIYENHSSNKKGLGHTKAKTPYNPHNNYIGIPDNRLCTHCGNNGHFKETCMVKIKSNQKNIAYVDKKKHNKPGPSLKGARHPGWTKKI